MEHIDPRYVAERSTSPTGDEARKARLLQSMKNRVELHNAAALEHPMLDKNKRKSTYRRSRKDDTPRKKKIREIKVVLLGEPGVGKSTLVAMPLSRDTLSEVCC